MRATLKRWFEPYFEGADLRSLTIWLSAMVLMALAVYPGHNTGYDRLFGTGGTPFVDDVLPYARSTGWMPYAWHHFAVLILFCLAPLAIVKFYFRDRLKDYGIALGDWRWGGKVILIAVIVVPIGVYLSAGDPWFCAEYPLVDAARDSWTAFGLLAILYLPYYIGWETLFRGYLLFGLEKRHGIYLALMAQTALSAIIHINKPLGETLSAIPGGIFMGIVAWRTRSILWPLLFHWYLGAMNTLMCSNLLAR